MNLNLANHPLPTNREELVQWLPLIMHDLDRVGLHATARQMNEVTRQAGWELAEQLMKEKAEEHDEVQP